MAVLEEQAVRDWLATDTKSWLTPPYFDASLIGTEYHSYGNETTTLADAHAALDDMLSLDRDDRIGYLTARGYRKSDLDRLLSVQRTWINRDARNRLRRLAEEGAESRGDFAALLSAWLDESDAARLAALLYERQLPAPHLALSHAICDAAELAYAAHRLSKIDLAQNRHSLVSDSDLAWAERDQRIVDAGCDEEVLQWPPY